MKIKAYKLELILNKIFREIILSDDMQDELSLGTVKDCDIRFPADDFDEDFAIMLQRTNRDEWRLQCSPNLRISDKASHDEQEILLSGNKSFRLTSKSSGAEVCRGNLSRTFINDEQNFFRSVDLTGVNTFSIGGDSRCEIRIRDQEIGSNCLIFQRASDGWNVCDNGIENGYEINGSGYSGRHKLHDYDMISICGYSFSLRKDRLRFCPISEISVNGFNVLEHKDSRSNLVYPYLKRSTRVYYPIPEERLKIQKPPNRTSKPDQNLLITLLPLIIMAVVMVVLRFVIGSNGMYLAFMLASMSIGVGTSTYNYFHQKKKAEEDENNRVIVYREYIEGKIQRLENLRMTERTAAEKNTPNIERTMRTVFHFDHHLYERTPDQSDFAAARLGTGTVISNCPVEYTPDEYRMADDPMSDWPEQLRQHYEKIDNMPILLHFREASVVGVIGSPDQVYEAVKLMTMDLAVHHAPSELQLGFLLEKQKTGQHAWVRWIPHCNHGNGMRNIASDNESYRHYIDYLYQIMVHRYEYSRNNVRPIPHYVVFVLDEFDLFQHPISRFFSQSASLGFSFVFCGHTAESLPQCDHLVRLKNGEGIVVDASNGNRTQVYTPSYLPDEAAHKAARKLAGVIIDEVGAEQQLTTKLSLYKLLGIYDADEFDYLNHWRAASVFKTLAAPIGINSKNDIIYLDVDEKAHGPHGLVAGTTGSGKSELLQTYIISMAAHYHPYEVGFVIIDFKGGGLANQLQGLPHLLGKITNIDSGEITRSLQSIQAELKKREYLFAQADVNNINDYIRKYRAGTIEIPLPHIILVVDEFAELKAKQPEFMKELISASRVGRSLGVHLLLATQKPAGVVDEQIWSNSHFRLCLKVQSAVDSNEMLKMPLAAEIKNPGRAYLQVGNNEIFELFQSAFSGGPANGQLLESDRGYALMRVYINGNRDVIFKQQSRQAASEQSELREMVRSISACCKNNNITPLSGICLDPLETNIPFPSTDSKRNTTEIIAEVGVYDDPANQRKVPTTISVSTKNTIVIGSTQSGKTNFLMTLIRSLSSSYSPKDVQFYIIDFASMVLKNFELQPHVGGVVTAVEEEKLQNLMKLLLSEIDKRKQLMSNFGVGSFMAYREAGMRDLPQIVLIVDNITALRDNTFREEDPLLSICREGLSVGISVVVANTQTASVSYKYLSNFGCKIALFCNDPSEYSMLMGNCKIKNESIPGRCIIEKEKKLYSCQIYCAFDGDKEVQRIYSIRKFVDENNARYPECRAKAIPTIPEFLSYQELQASAQPQGKSTEVLAGLDYSTIAPVRIDFGRIVQLAVIDPTETYKYTWIRYAVETLYINSQKSIDVYVVDGFDRKLTELQNSPYVHQYSFRADDARTIVVEIEEELARRYQLLQSGDENPLADEKLIVLIIEHCDAAAAIASDLAAQAAYRNIIGRYKRMGVCVLLSCVANEMISYDTPEVVKKAKEYRQILYFGDISDLKFIELPLNTIKQYKGGLGSSEGFFIRGGNCIKLKCPDEYEDHENETLPENS